MQIDSLKKEEAKDLTIHDVHHYTLLYIILFGLLIGAIILALLWRRRRRLQASASGAGNCPLDGGREGDAECSVGVSSVISECKESDQRCVVKSEEQGTSPLVFRRVKFEVPTFEAPICSEANK
ncbi:hypothetical protein ACJJTC_015022 [Scirpophaga incertulas]